MSLSNWINQHSMLVAPIAAGGLVIAVLIWLLGGGDDDMSRYSYRYFYDLNTGEIIVDENSKVPPIRSASGSDAVGAIMIGCGTCDDREDMQLGWLEKYSDEAKEMIKTGPGEGSAPFGDNVQAPGAPDNMEKFREVMDRDHLLALPPKPGEQLQWVSQGFPEGQYVITQAMRQCAGGKKRARVCAVTEEELP